VDAGKRTFGVDGIQPKPDKIGSSIKQMMSSPYGLSIWICHRHFIARALMMTSRNSSLYQRARLFSSTMVKAKEHGPVVWHLTKGRVPSSALRRLSSS